MPSQCRRTQQKLARKSHVGMIAKKLSSRLSGKQHLERMTTTNKLLPVGSLKRKCVRNLFTGWASTLVGQGRVLTKKLAEQVCRRLRKKFDLGPATDDGHETRVLHHLLKLARKRKLGAAARPTMSSVDLLDTIPMEINEDRRHHSSVCWVIFSINLSNAYVDKWRIQQFTQDTCFKNRMMINQSLQT